MPLNPCIYFPSLLEQYEHNFCPFIALQRQPKFTNNHNPTKHISAFNCLRRSALLVARLSRGYGDCMPPAMDCVVALSGYRVSTLPLGSWLEACRVRYSAGNIARPPVGSMVKTGAYYYANISVRHVDCIYTMQRFGSKKCKLDHNSHAQKFLQFLSERLRCESFA